MFNLLKKISKYKFQSMITFRHKSNTKQIKIKTKRELNDKMSPWLQDLFGIKNPIVGFKVASNKYYDTESFYTNKDRFYNQVVDIIEANDQLEISFVSDNLNSSSNVRNPAQPNIVEDFCDQVNEAFKIVNDIKSFQRMLQDKNQLSILFSINQIFRKEITQSINLIKSQQNCKINFYIKINPNKNSEYPTYSIYIGKKLVAILNLSRQYKQNIIMATQRFSKRPPKQQNDRKFVQQQREQQAFRASFEHQNQAPSFTTYQLQQRLNQQACQDYLSRMLSQKYLKKYEYLKLNQKCQQNFVEFYRIFCQGIIDNDYQNFKNQILHKVQNNLQLLLSNVDEMDLSRPISREEQRKQNLKKSVSNIEIVKVENYFQILDQLKSLLNPSSMASVKTELLDQNQVIFKGFADYLSRRISKQQLAQYLQKVVDKNKKRPVSRCLPRSANRNRDPAYHSQDEIFSVPQTTLKPIPSANSNQNNFDQQFIQDKGGQPPKKQEAQLIKLMGEKLSSGPSSGIKQNKNDNKQTPPMFGSSKQQNNFSPIKYMSDIQSNYKQAWTRLESKANLFEPEQYGLLYYYLQSRDDSISNYIQQLQWNQQSTITKLKKFLQQRVVQIMEQNFSHYDLDALTLNRNSPQIDCIYQNFKYQSDLNKFLTSLQTQLSIITSRSPSPSPSPSMSYKPISQRVPVGQVLTKKSSDSKLLDKGRKSSLRKYSDQHLQIQSPKQSSFSRPKTNEPSSVVYLQILHKFWKDQFEQMIQHCNFTEQKKQQYLRQAFKDGNPSVYSWINQFVQGRLRIVDADELKSSLKIKQQQNKYIMRVVPIFSQILRCFVDEGRITDKMRKWCVVQLMELNPNIIGAFQCYVKIKNNEQFVDSITMAYEMQNSQMQYFRSYLKRIQEVLKSVSVQDQIGMAIFKLYPQHIKAICQYYFVSGNADQLLDNLDTMHSVQRKRRQVKIATLNFSGINLNPFEYYDGSEQYTQISNYMKQIIKNQTDNMQGEWGAIDKLYYKNKMSVRFGQAACDGERLLTFEQFSQKWLSQFKINKPEGITDQSQNSIRVCMLFDYYCYLSMIRYIYKTNWKIIDQVDQKLKKTNKIYRIEGIQKLDPNLLKQYLIKKRNRSASKVEKKYQMAMEYFMKNNLDVFCLQQAGEPAWGEELIHQYGWVKGGNSVIIFRKDKFGQPRTNLIQKYKQKLNFNNDTAFYFGDRGYLLLSIHLRSNPSICIEQAEQIFKVLQQIYDEHPLIKIIVGMDANHFIGGSKSNFLNFVPKSKQEITTNKMRTSIQAQFRKIDELSRSSKDAILTNLQIKEYAIQKISGKLAEMDDFIPDDEHPYDHFSVRALI